MVSTRRSSARLQEKTASAPSSPSTPSATQASPARATRSATKATPPSGSARQTARKSTPTKSTGSGAKRTRGRRSTGKAGSSESDEGVATESDSISEQQDAGSAVDEPENDVKKQLFAEETTTPASSSATTTSVSSATKDNVESEPESIELVEEKAEVVAVQEEEEEEEIVMMADSDDEEEADEAATEPTAQEGDEAEDEDDDDFDIAEYAKLAATGISLSTTSSAIGAQAATATKPGYNLVPDTLDSGASNRVKFLEFEGSKLGQGAKVVADTAAVEEQKVLDHQLSKVAKANRQRQEAKNTDVSAGRKWFDMSTHEMDSDARRDFSLLRMRNYLDPKKFYKTSDHTKKMPKHFQFGTVIEGAHEFKSARLSKKERKQTFTEEIMADDAIRKYTKRVFLQVQDSKAGHAKKKQKRR